MNSAWKVLISVLASATVLFGGFIVLLIVAFTGKDVFYQALVIVSAVVIWLFVIIQIWGLFKPKVRRIALGVTVSAVLLTVTAYEINKAYDNSIEEVNEQGVDLSLYDPFREDTLAVPLIEPSSLKIAGNPPRIDGATALYPLYSAFAKAVYPAENTAESNGLDDEKGKDGVAFAKMANEIVACTNTRNAYGRLIEGEADIIFVAGPSAEQLQMARESNVELKLTPIGREAFVFFVNAQNPVSALSITDIQGIYSGKIKNWRDLGGQNTKIRAFQRPENSGSQTALIKFMGDIPLTTPPQKNVATGMGEIVQRVSSYKNYDNAIGYSFLFFATEMVNDNKIKLLAVNGVAPTRENVANETYPYVAEFYAVTAGTKNPNVEKFIEWIRSDQGQYLVEKTGYTPLRSTDKSP
ncbi:hypothetical protein Sgly_1821 [Syntrophobotulus glycolicus DSM 8271]|uniref:PBP domain-containing protein n=1 Tax=Syntrophobotulus glycolicus (strain DSM 8271 / FlGlyR) TaxID=645991 RepID=F0T031_SYNGF|nr:substrate-binding domain-containing protein [Syntrophobotulus glycolicus]ADY56118.1 hypothetical protein Sgly_1821 [Syntrophobotulus glycolicus DSM 8271]